MPRKLGERIQRDESGFTLIELMIIIVILDYVFGKSALYLFK